MIAISIRQPWCWAVETRQLATAPAATFQVLSGWVALYAAAPERLDDDALARLGVADVPDTLLSGGLTGAAFLLSIRRDDQGRLSYAFADAFRLQRPIRHRGRGFRWRLPPDVARMVEAEIERREARLMRGAGRAA